MTSQTPGVPACRQEVGDTGGARPEFRGCTEDAGEKGPW